MDEPDIEPQWDRAQNEVLDSGNAKRRAELLLKKWSELGISTKRVMRWAIVFDREQDDLPPESSPAHASKAKSKLAEQIRSQNVYDFLGDILPWCHYHFADALASRDQREAFRRAVWPIPGSPDRRFSGHESNRLARDDVAQGRFEEAQFAVASIRVAFKDWAQGEIDSAELYVRCAKTHSEYGEKIARHYGRDVDDAVQWARDVQAVQSLVVAAHRTAEFCDAHGVKGPKQCFQILREVTKNSRGR